MHFQRWCDAKFGADYYPSISKIPRPLWADYLDWYGDTLSLPIEYEVEVQDIAWIEARDCFELQTSTSPVYAQFVVICSGIESAGSGFIPSVVQDNLPPEVYAHTMGDLPLERINGQDVVVLGGGAGAFDSANVALRAGARRVDLMVRRPDLPPVHRVCWGSKWYGYHRHYIELPDHMKWDYSLADLELRRAAAAAHVLRGGRRPALRALWLGRHRVAVLSGQQDRRGLWRARNSPMTS